MALSLNSFLLALIAMLGFGIQAFLYKEAAHRSLRSRTIVFWFSLLTCAALWLAALFRDEPFAPSLFVLFLSGLDACAYFSSSLLRLEALRFIPGHLAFLILRCNIVVVLVFSFSFLGEKVSLNHIVAFSLLVLIAKLTVMDKERDAQDSGNYRKGLALVLAATFGSATAHIVTKYAGEANQILEYMTLANTGICVLSLLESRFRSGEVVYLPHTPEFVIAVLSGIVNLIAWVASLYAMQGGSLSTVSFVIGMAFVIPIALSSVVHRERPSRRRVQALILTVVVLIVLKFA